MLNYMELHSNITAAVNTSFQNSIYQIFNFCYERRKITATDFSCDLCQSIHSTEYNCIMGTFSAHHHINAMAHLQ